MLVEAGTVTQVSEERERLSLPEEAEIVTLKREAYDIVRKLADDLHTAYKIAEMRLKERMDAEKVGGLKVGDVNYVPAETTYINVQDLDEFVKWAEAEGHTEFLKLDANKKALNEEMHRRLDDGEALPPGIGFYVKEYVSQRAA